MSQKYKKVEDAAGYSDDDYTFLSVDSDKSAGKVAHITRNIMIHCKSIGMVMRRSNE